MSRTAPLAARCGRCHALVLEVRVDFQLGVLVGAPRLDPISLVGTQITVCVLTGIQLWQVQERAGTTTTSSRSRWWPVRPVDGHTAPVHACGRVWDAPALELAPDEPVYPELPPF